MFEKKKLTNFQIKAAFEYFNDLYTKSGQTVTYSKFICHNRDILVKPYLAMQGLVYDESKDPEFMAFNQAVADLRMKYCVMKDGKPCYNEAGNIEIANIQEFTAEIEKLKTTTYQNLFNRLTNKAKTNDAVMNQVNEIDVEVLTATEFIPDAPPFIVGMFIYGVN